jgi:pentose-5-phosphate-3-epimerase
MQSELEQNKSAGEVEVDGGIDEETAPLAVEAGANTLVAGTAGGHLEKAAAR